MLALNIIRVIGLLGLLILFGAYVGEAWQRSRDQAVLCVVVPFYVYYFAFIKSTRAPGFRLALIISTALLLLPQFFFLLKEFWSVIFG